MAEVTTDSGRVSSLSARDRLSDGTRRLCCGRFGLFEWLLVAVSLMNIVLCISLSIHRLVIVVSTNVKQPDFVFTILLIINSVFCLFYVIHGLLRELQFEIYMFICAAVFVVGYCIVEYSFSKPVERTEEKLARLILCCIFAPINIVLAVKIAREFGWLEFRILGASQHMQSMYHQATFFESLLKFDLQAAVSFTILVTVNEIIASTANKAALCILCIGIPFCVLFMFLGRTSMRQEWRLGSIFFTLLGLVAPAFVVYSIVMIYKNDGLYFDKKNTINTIIASEYVVGGLTLLVRGVLLVELYIVYRNYGRGLRERAFDDVANERTGLLAR